MVDNQSEPLRTPQTTLLDTFIPGFSLFVSAIQKYLKIDISVYIPYVLAIFLLFIAGQHVSRNIYSQIEDFFVCCADIRVDDELYNMFMAWVATQKFALQSRRFVANTNVNSRNWALWESFDSDSDASEDEDDFDYIPETIEAGTINPIIKSKKKGKPLLYTPSFGTHYFWHKGRLFLFKRTECQNERNYVPASEREEISVSTFGRNPQALKELLDLCRANYIKGDEDKTLIYRGSVKAGTTEPSWTRCMSRVSRPFSTVVLDENVKESLLADLRDYLHPYTRRWYSNRGIPYRRGYLLYGPPGTGKSSLSFAIAGFFKLKIYIVSLNSLSMNEENLGTLFADLPQRCVVLLEDIDTAGLTNTREDPAKAAEDAKVTEESKISKPADAPSAPINPLSGRISLSALLNVLDGVASQEGRVLIMTTNHVDKLDKALIRPGRVDMMVKFALADRAVTATLFRSIFATLEGDLPSVPKTDSGTATPLPSTGVDATQLVMKARAGINKSSGALEIRSKDTIESDEKEKKAEEQRIAVLAEDFAELIPDATFSPAEIQGYLLKHKRSAEAAIENAAEWVVKTREEKRTERERKKKELEEAEKKAVQEAEVKKAEEKKAEEKKADEAKPKGDEVSDVQVKKVASTVTVNGVNPATNGTEALTNGVTT